MPGSPRKKRGEAPQSGAKPGATLRRCSARAAEMAPWRTFVRLERMRRWRDELAATEDGERFIPQKAERCRALPAKNAGSPHKPGQSPALHSDCGQCVRRRGFFAERTDHSLSVAPG